MSEKHAVDVDKAGLLQKLFGGVEQDPFPYYDALREMGDGVHEAEILQAVLVTRYDDLRKIGADPKTFSSDIFFLTGPGIHDPTDPEHRRFIETARRLFMASDPPRHTQIRSTFRHAFTPDTVRRWRPIVEEITDEALSRFQPGQEVDLMSGLAAEVPVAVIAQILGVPKDTWQHFREWSYAYASTFDPMVTGDRRDKAIRTSLVLFDYLSDLIEERRAAPGDDLISHMLATRTFDGEVLTLHDMVSQVALLLVAGNETTTNLVGNGVTLLLSQPDTKDAVIADPTLLPGAIEEMLRFDPPLHLTARKATSEVRVGEHDLAPGTLVMPCIPAANRDPRAFPDAATFDIRRVDNTHLTFFHGIHYCVGAPGPAGGHDHPRQAACGLPQHSQRQSAAGSADGECGCARLGIAPGDPMSDSVHVEVRSETCMASGYCIRSAPAVFGADENGWVVVLDADPRGHTAEVRQAAAMCPVAAIDVFDSDDRQL